MHIPFPFSSRAQSSAARGDTTGFRPLRHPQRGFSLLEVMLALAISLAIGALLISNLRSSTENQQAVIVGQQAGDVGHAMNAYVAMRYGDITNLTTIGSGCGSLTATGFSGIGSDTSQMGTPTDPGPRCCGTYAGVSYCQITSDTLRRNGLLPNSFSGYNAYGAQYEYFIRVQGASPSYVVDGIVFTDTPYTSGGTTPRYDLLGQAMNAAGADSGETQASATLVSGLNGAWNDTWPFINQLGLLAYRVGYGTSGFNAYLRLDGSTPMTGDLVMGTPTSRHNIDYVANLDAQTATFEGTGTDNTATVSIANSTPAGASSTDFQPITTGTGAGGIAIRNDTGVYVMGRTTAAAAPLTAKNLVASGGYIDASASGVAPTSPAGTPGTVSADSVVSRGNVQLTGTGGAYGFLFDPAYGGGWYMTDSSWIRAAGDKNIYTAGSMRADTYLAAASQLQVGNGTAATTVTPGSACSSVAGLSGVPMAESNAANEILQCKNGTWVPIGVSTTLVTGSTVGPGGTSTATCGSGTVATGGGYRMASYAPVSPSGLGNAPDVSMPNGTTGWYVYVDPVATGDSTFTAYALCAPGA